MSHLPFWSLFQWPVYMLTYVVSHDFAHIPFTFISISVVWIFPLTFVLYKFYVFSLSPLTDDESWMSKNEFVIQRLCHLLNHWFCQISSTGYVESILKEEEMSLFFVTILALKFVLKLRFPTTKSYGK